MIAVFSTSSPQTSVALCSDTEIWSANLWSPRMASGTCLKLLDKLLEESGTRLDQIDTFAADFGPGSFTGTRVGIVLAKTLAFTHNKRCAALNAFDLIDPNQTVSLPNKKNEVFIRVVGCEPELAPKPPQGAIGYGPDIEVPNYPEPGKWPDILRAAETIDPIQFEAKYWVEPSISVPKRKYGLGN